MERSPDAVERTFIVLNRQATEVLTQLQQMKLPTPVVIPDEFASLKTAIEKCLAKGSPVQTNRSASEKEPGRVTGRGSGH